MTKKKVIILIIAVSAIVLLIYIPIVAVYFSKNIGNKDTSLDNAEIKEENSKDKSSVNNENLLHYYSCDKNNLCGLEEVYSYRDSVLLVFDKEIMDSNAEIYGGSFLNTVKGLYSVDAELSVLNAYPTVTLTPTATLDIDKYVVLIPFTYDTADIRDPEKDVESVEAGINDTFFIDYYNSRIVITIQNRKNDKYEILNQWYDEKECVWGDVKSEVVNERQNFL